MSILRWIEYFIQLNHSDDAAVVFKNIAFVHLRECESQGKWNIHTNRNSLFVALLRTQHNFETEMKTEL